jgi:hypothetical protein
VLSAQDILQPPHIDFFQEVYPLSLMLPFQIAFIIVMNLHKLLFHEFVVCSLCCLQSTACSSRDLIKLPQTVIS